MSIYLRRLCFFSVPIADAHSNLFTHRRLDDERPLTPAEEAELARLEAEYAAAEEYNEFERTAAEDAAFKVEDAVRVLFAEQAGKAP